MGCTANTARVLGWSRRRGASLLTPGVYYVSDSNSLPFSFVFLPFDIYSPFLEFHVGK
jgi:hypothetical protein